MPCELSQLGLVKLTGNLSSISLLLAYVGDLLNWRSDGRDWLGLTFRVFAGLHDEATQS